MSYRYLEVNQIHLPQLEEYGPYEAILMDPPWDLTPLPSRWKNDNNNRKHITISDDSESEDCFDRENNNNHRWTVSPEEMVSCSFPFHSIMISNN